MNPANRIFRAEIQAEHMHTLFRPTSFITIISGHIMAGAILVFILWNMASHATLLTWLIALYGLAAIRWFSARAYKQHPPSLEAVPRWGLATAALMGLLGVTWGGAAILFLDPEQPMSLIIITIILVGMSCTGVVIFASYPLAFITFVVPMITSLLMVLLLRAGEVGVVLTILSFIMLVITWLYVSNFHRVLDDSLRLRFENIALRQETEEKSALLETTLQNIRQGISVVDRNGRLRMWNQRFLDLLGLSRRHMDDQNLNTILQAADPPLPELSTERLEYRRTDGAVIEVLQNAMPDGDQVLTYTDISDLKRREEALEQANAAKTRFLATASHDLRQPIHALGLFFAVLAEQARNPETAPLIKQIEDSIHAIDTMLNALLDISKLDAGVIHPQVGPVAVAGLFQRLETEYQPLARKTGNALRMRPCQAIVQSDATMLERMLRNLISNALRYTKNGRVLIAARRRSAGLRFEVHDTGPGIPADKLDDIFQEFYQLGNPERDRRQGLGLGLAIVKRVAALLGHDLTVRSRLGHGSCFAITAPLSQESPSSLPFPAMIVPGLELWNHRVLVLDDDHAILAAMEGLLKRWGCQVSMAASVEEAREKIAANALPPELLIVDYRLPGQVSGLEAATALQTALGRRVPVLVITGDTAPDRLREAQASGYPLLHKPVQPAKLRSMMRHLIDL